MQIPLKETICIKCESLFSEKNVICWICPDTGKGYDDGLVLYIPLIHHNLFVALLWGPYDKPC